MSKRLAVDLCCGRGGWTAGLLAEGWDVIGFDVVKPTTFPPSARFVLQDVCTLSGVAWRGRVSLVVASPPCTEFSQVWRFAHHRMPDPVKGMVLVRACFRIAQECGAPFVIENVQDARVWFAPEFGAPTWHVGPFYFWGDAPVLRPMGRFVKGVWNTNPHRTSSGRVITKRRGAAYVRDRAARARIPIEIARAVGAQL